MAARIIADSYYYSKSQADARKKTDGEKASGSLFEAQSEIPEDKFDIWLRVYFNEPALKLVPSYVTPNMITLFNHVITVGLLFCAAYAPMVEEENPNKALYLRLACGVFSFLNMMLDCLDGMHARKTGQSSKIGEILDHSFDAFNVPMLGGSLPLSFASDPITTIFTVVGSVMVYNAQLVMYRYQRVMIIPPISGPMAQFMLAVTHFATAFILRVFERDNKFLLMCYGVFVLGSLIGQFRSVWFFIKHLLWSFETSHVFPHVLFVMLNCLPIAFYCFNWIDRVMYVVISSVLSFRLNGRLLLSTLLTFRNAEKYPATLLPYCSFSLMTLLLIGFMSAGEKGVLLVDESIIPLWVYPYYLYVVVVYVIVNYIMFVVDLEAKRDEL